MRRLLLLATSVIALAASSVSVSEGCERVVSSSRVQFPLTNPDRVFEVRKVYDDQNRLVRIESDSPEIASHRDLRALLLAEHEARRARYGKISGRLELRFGAMTGSTRERVTIHIRRPLFRHRNKLETQLETRIADAVAQAEQLAPVTTADVLAHRYGLAIEERLSDDAFVVVVSKADLEAMRFDGSIAAIEAYVDEQPVDVPYSSLATSSYNPPPLPAGAQGYDVHAATFELGLWQSFVDCLGDLDPANIDIDTTPEPGNDNEVHSQEVFDFLWHAAPAATFYHHAGLNYSASTAQQFLLDHAIESTSLSYTRSVSDQNSYEFLLMDDFAYHYPYTNFVNPTANAGYEYEVHWQCYNCISVGNVRHTAETYYELAGCTQTRNPDPVHGGCIDGSPSPPCAGDRELPHLVAPGVTPSPTNEPLVDPVCLPGHGVWCGTSFSAPTVNGVVADVISADPARMRYAPEKVRVALLLTAHNVHQSHWNLLQDGRDGTGVVSGNHAVQFARNHAEVLPGGTAEHGLAVGSIREHPAPNDLRFWVRVPDPMPRGRHLRIVLVWDSNPDIGNLRNALSDLDLAVGSDSRTFGSYSLDSNVEVVDVPHTVLTPGEVYPIDLLISDLDIPSGASTDFFYWSLGWTWTRTRADAPILPDGYEPNDSLGQAASLGVLGQLAVPNLTVHEPSNDDYYGLTAETTGELYVDIWFAQEQGDLDVMVYDASGSMIGYSGSVTDDERVTVPVTGGALYYVRVYGYAGALHPNYTLAIDLYTGASSFCDPGDQHVFCWEPVPGATQYEVRRSATPVFDAPCAGATTPDTSWQDAQVPDPGQVYNYLSRMISPTVGSWGTDSAGNERVGICE